MIKLLLTFGNFIIGIFLNYKFSQVFSETKFHIVLFFTFPARNCPSFPCRNYSLVNSSFKFFWLKKEVQVEQRRDPTRNIALSSDFSIELFPGTSVMNLDRFEFKRLRKAKIIVSKSASNNTFSGFIPWCWFCFCAMQTNPMLNKPSNDNNKCLFTKKIFS